MFRLLKFNKWNKAFLNHKLFYIIPLLKPLSEFECAFVASANRVFFKDSWTLLSIAQRAYIFDFLNS